MTVPNPHRLQGVLWEHQREALAAMTRYLDRFDSSRPRTALVHMPTGSGKTGVIASLAHSLNGSGPVVMLALRIALREQLARDVRKRFFGRAGIGPASPLGVW